MYQDLCEHLRHYHQEKVEMFYHSAQKSTDADDVRLDISEMMIFLALYDGRADLPGDIQEFLEETMTEHYDRFRVLLKQVTDKKYATLLSRRGGKVTLKGAWLKDCSYANKTDRDNLE